MTCFVAKRQRIEEPSSSIERAPDNGRAQVTGRARVTRREEREHESTSDRYRYTTTYAYGDTLAAAGAAAPPRPARPPEASGGAEAEGSKPNIASDDWDSAGIGGATHTTYTTDYIRPSLAAGSRHVVCRASGLVNLSVFGIKGSLGLRLPVLSLGLWGWLACWRGAYAWPRGHLPPAAPGLCLKPSISLRTNSPINMDMG
jgi:hypothetical protein